MIKVNYDTDGNILGFYPDDIGYATIPEPYIEIDKATHQDCIQNPGLRRVDIATQKIVEYTRPEPTAKELLQQQIDALDPKYKSRFDQLALDYAAALIDGNTDLVAEIKAEKDTLTAAYQGAMEEIKNG